MKDVLDLAIQEVGVYEWAEGHNPIVLNYFRDSGHPEIVNDETAWCAAFVGAMLERCDYTPTGSLLARSYMKWGEGIPLKDARPGDIAVFQRGTSSWQGHVGFFVDMRDDGYIMLLGGNQSDQVNVQHRSTNKLLGIRRGVSNRPVAQPVVRSKPNPLMALFAALAKFFGGKK